MNKKLSLSAYAGTMANAKADCARLRILREQEEKTNRDTSEQLQLEDILGDYWLLLEALIDVFEKNI